MRTEYLDARYGLATSIWAAAIVWGAATPSLPGLFLLDLPFMDKLVHFASYALLCWLAAMALRKAKRSHGLWIVIALPLGFCVVLGMLTEWLQMMVKSRSCELGDFAADTLGALAVAALLGRPVRLPGRQDVTE